MATNKLALVTGGSRGIGAAVCAGLRAAGWDVLAPTRAECDWADGDSVGKWWGDMGRGPFDAVVFVHGEWLSHPHVWSYHYNRQWRMRVLEPISILDEIFLEQRQAPPAVVFVSSTQAFGGRAETNAYAMACAAQVRLALGLAQSGRCRANVVCPGLTNTAMAAAVRASGDCRPDAVAQPPEAVAAAVLRLVTGDENGKVLRVVDGTVTEAKWMWA